MKVQNYTIVDDHVSILMYQNSLYNTFTFKLMRSTAWFANKTINHVKITIEPNFPARPHHWFSKQYSPYSSLFPLNLKLSETLT